MAQRNGFAERVLEPPKVLRNGPQKNNNISKCETMKKLRSNSVGRGLSTR